MGRWREIRKELNEKIKRGEKFDIKIKDISTGRIHGTIYSKDNKMRKAVLVVHGTSGNRYGLGVLSERLAEAGYFCLNVDLPSHYQNPDPYTIGHICEMIHEGIHLLKSTYGFGQVAVIGHSVGSTAAVFSAGGYNTRLENSLYNHFERINSLAEKLEKSEDKKRLIQAIEGEYNQMKSEIVSSMKYVISNGLVPYCYILLAPVLKVKGGLPALGLIRRLPKRAIKFIVETMLHKPALKQIEKEGNPVHFKPEEDPDYVNWQFLKTKDAHSLLEYLAHMKELPDYLKLIEEMIKFRKKDGRIVFFQYYYDKYIKYKPKLVIYGARDLYIKPFLPFAKTRIDKVYHAFGNTRVSYGNFSHIMVENPKQQFGALAVRNAGVTEEIISFLDNH